MPIKRPRWPLIALIGLSLLTVVFIWPTALNAQCGTQASSCKNCHEVQGEHPVGASGDWHINHAFGDFCEFCHAGNVTATEKPAAHEGMIYPLSDPAGSCASCHPMDYEDLSVDYAAVLGISLDDVASGGGTTGGGSSDISAASGSSDTATTVDSTAEEAPAPTGGGVVDFNIRYENNSRSGLDFSSGDYVLTFMIIALVLVFAILIWRFEGLGDRWAEMRGTLQPAFAGAGAHSTSPSVQALVPALENANPAVLASLSKLLEGDQEQSAHLLQALARINPRLVDAVSRLDDSDLELLVALVREMKK